MWPVSKYLYYIYIHIWMYVCMYMYMYTCQRMSCICSLSCIYLYMCISSQSRSRHDLARCQRWWWQCQRLKIFVWECWGIWGAWTSWILCTFASHTSLPASSDIDWCCFYYFLRNSLVALLEALFARIPLTLGRNLLFWLEKNRDFEPEELTYTSPGGSLWELEWEFRVGLRQDGLPASRFRDKWQIWNGKRNFQSLPNRHICSRSKMFCTGGAKRWRFSGRMWQKTSQVKKTFSCARASHSSQKCDKCHIFCHRKKWQLWRHSPKSERGSWEDTWERGLGDCARARDVVLAWANMTCCAGLVLRFVLYFGVCAHVCISVCIRV